eukprot:Skav230040  [mRNA]  locus=scaffold465:174258:186748:+ [translate_table: standard]
MVRVVIRVACAYWPAFAFEQGRGQASQETRAKENREFVDMAAAQRMTQKLLMEAQSALDKVYEGVSFVQVRSTRQTIPGFAVMEMLKQVQKNAMRLGEEALQADQDSREAFEKLSREIDAEIASTTKDIGKKSIVKSDLQSDVAEAKRKMGLTEDELDSLAETNMALHKSCDFVVKNFAKTQAARSAEIQAGTEVHRLARRGPCRLASRKEFYHRTVLGIAGAWSEKNLSPRLVKLRYDFFEAKRRDLCHDSFDVLSFQGREGNLNRDDFTSGFCRRLAAARRARDALLADERREKESSNQQLLGCCSLVQVDLLALVSKDSSLGGGHLSSAIDVLPGSFGLASAADGRWESGLSKGAILALNSDTLKMERQKLLRAQAVGGERSRSLQVPGRSLQRLLLRKQLESANQFLTNEAQNQEDAMREHSRKMKDTRVHTEAESIPSCIMWGS